MDGQELCILNSQREMYEESLDYCLEDVICPAGYSCVIENCLCVEEVCAGD